VAYERTRLPVIRASEVGEYVYCARAWWLRRVAGIEPADRERRDAGIVRHTRHNRMLRMSTTLLVLAGILVLAALLLVAL
jgi:CRISPR/Cas system-associated exonuclease Cas4 (RecB family)